MDKVSGYAGGEPHEFLVSVGGVSFAVAGVTINLSGLAVAAIAGILLNAILPGNDYEFDAADGSEAATSSNLQV